MLQKISLRSRTPDKYRLIIGDDLIRDIDKLASELKGVRICHINSTPFGGGVAELLNSYLPLMRGLGIHADWQVIHGDQRFFTMTKSLHNALQGGEGSLIKREETQRIYKTQTRLTRVIWTAITTYSSLMTHNRRHYVSSVKRHEPSGSGAVT